VSAADWKPYDVPGLAGLLAEQPTDSGTHAMAWQQAYETLTDQRQRLEAARAALTEAWPASPGSAAGSFFDQVDALTHAMSATAETAVNAHGALTGIVTAVDGATAKVDTLHQSWQQNQTTIGGIVPADDWTQPLNNQAHAVMGQADAAIAEHATQLTPPVPYTPHASHEVSTPLPTKSSQIDGRTTSSAHTPAGSSTTSQTSLSAVLTSAGSNSASSGTDIKSAAGIYVSGPSGGTKIANSLVAATSGAMIAPRRGSVGAGADETTDTPALGSDQRADGEDTIRNVESAQRDSPSSLGWPASSDLDNVGIRNVLSSPGRSSAGTMDMSSHVSRPEPQIAPKSIATDGTATTVSSGRSASALTAGSVGNGETPVIGGMLSAPAALGAREAVKRRSEHVGWPMPIGGPSILEPAAEPPVVHDPGPGVLGIDR
jgi:hypothetical protein